MGEFIKKRIGLTNVYLLPAKEGYVLIDVGTKLRHNKLMRFLKENNVSPQEIKLIIITHGHIDHAGGLKKLKRFTDAKILIHENDKHALVVGKNSKVKTVSAFLNIFLVLTPRFIDRFDPIEPDIVVKEEFSLVEYGLNAKIIHTPGHTMGGISVLDEEGNAFVGDCAKGHPYRIRAGYPTIAIDMQKLKQSWKLLIREGAKRIHMAHGWSFGIEILQKRLKKKKR